MEVWDFFAILGTVSFSLQGGLIAIENEYDLLAVYLFGIITAFGGGALRHVLLGESNLDLWNQDTLFFIAIVSITLVLLFPKFFLKSEQFWTSILDAIGLISFSIQGASRALAMDLPVSAIVSAALLTAIGGGVMRDLLSQRRPVLLSENVYVLWVVLVGLIIGLRWATTNYHFLLLFVVFTTLRICSYEYDWKIPYRRL